MIKKIILVVFILAIISGGTVFALDKLSTKQKLEEAKRIEQEKEEYKRMEEIAIEDVKKKDVKEVIETTNPDNPNEIKREWRGEDSLTYRIEAVRNADGTYTGTIIGRNMYDDFIEFNFSFKDLSQRGLDDLLKK